jgi:hypothetical protein
VTAGPCAAVCESIGHRRHAKLRRVGTTRHVKTGLVVAQGLTFGPAALPFLVYAGVDLKELEELVYDTIPPGLSRLDTGNHANEDVEKLTTDGSIVREMPPLTKVEFRIINFDRAERP